VTVQQISSIARQVVAILAFIFGILTQAVSGIHLPAAISSVMVAVGGGLVALEHYLSDPSTGNPTPAPSSGSALPPGAS
jgi:hypothetical protein